MNMPLENVLHSGFAPHKGGQAFQQLACCMSTHSVWTWCLISLEDTTLTQGWRGSPNMQKWSKGGELTSRTVVHFGGLGVHGVCCHSLMSSSLQQGMPPYREVLKVERDGFLLTSFLASLKWDLVRKLLFSQYPFILVSAIAWQFPLPFPLDAWCVTYSYLTLGVCQ